MESSAADVTEGPGQAEPDPLIRVSALSVSFPKFGQERETILRDISFAVARGEVLALVGESGSGKTMLARALMQLVPPPGRMDAGSIDFDGKEITKIGERNLRALRGRDMAMVVSNPRGELDPLRTVGRQIGDVLRSHLALNNREVEERTLALLRDVQIPDPDRRYRAYPHELSGGMAQRVVIAIALACAPKFIISDDATSGLDVTVQAQVLELLRTLIADRGSSMLFITRDIGIAAHFADRVAVIYAGEIVEIAQRDEFFDNPVHPYTVLLLAAFSHNAKLRRYWLREDVSQDKTLAVAESGCVFRHRCVRAQDRCAAEVPMLRQLRADHYARCHFPIDR